MPVKEFEKQQIHSFIERTDLKHNLHLVVNNVLVRLRCETWSYFLCSFIIRLYIGKEIIQQIKFLYFM